MTQERAEALVAALVSRFGGEAEAEEVAVDGRYRFAIVSPGFEGAPSLRRQDDVWEVVSAVMSREESLDVSLVLTLAPSELSPEEVS